MVNYMCAFNQSELGKYFECTIIMIKLSYWTWVACAHKNSYITLVVPVVSQAVFRYMLNFVILAREWLLCVNIHKNTIMKFQETGLSCNTIWHWLQKDNMQVKEKFQIISLSKDKFSVVQCNWLLLVCLWLNSPIKKWALLFWGSQKDKMSDGSPRRCCVSSPPPPPIFSHCHGAGLLTIERKGWVILDINKKMATINSTKDEHKIKEKQEKKKTLYFAFFSCLVNVNCFYFLNFVSIQLLS